MCTVERLHVYSQFTESNCNIRKSKKVVTNREQRGKKTKTVVAAVKDENGRGSLSVRKLFQFVIHHVMYVSAKSTST